MKKRTPETRGEAQQKAKEGLFLLVCGIIAAWILSYTHGITRLRGLAYGAIIIGAIKAFNYWAMSKDLPEKANRKSMSNKNEVIEKNEVTCPHCKIQLILDDEEIANGRFVCPECMEISLVSPNVAV